MSAYLSADELAALIGCKKNQRSIMARWLDKNRWPYVLDITGLPKVSRAFHDSVMAGKPVAPRYDDEPNLQAFEEARKLDK